jgi:hypothetical protein
MFAAPRCAQAQAASSSFAARLWLRASVEVVGHDVDLCALFRPCGKPENASRLTFASRSALRMRACRPQKLSERPQVPRNTHGVTHGEWT